MKIVCISDIHGWHNHIDLPDADVLVVAGDATDTGTVEQIREFNEWLGFQPHKHKIVVAGNHDFNISHELITNAIYLENEGCEIEGVKFWGFPYTTIFYNWAFMQDEEGMRREASKIPSDIDVLVSHGAPEGILDKNKHTSHCGEIELLNYIKRHKPKYHLFGHIHEGYGSISVDETVCMNCAICNMNYDPVNKSIVFEF